MLDANLVYAQTRTLQQGRRLINSFLLANLCDVILTGIALNLPGFVEKGFLAGEMLAQDRVFELLIFKTAITAFMIGIYALATQHNGRWSRSIQVAFRIGTLLVWFAVAWNELNIVLALAEMF